MVFLEKTHKEQSQREDEKTEREEMTIVQCPEKYYSFKVADVVSRFVRKTGFVSKKTYGDIFAQKVTELSGDTVHLDSVENILIALKRQKVIFGKKMVRLLAEHQREVRCQSKR